MIDYISALLIPFLGTVLGSAFVFFMKKEMPVLLQKTLLGFASGVMVAASVWSLLIPGIELEAESGKMAILPAIIGFFVRNRLFIIHRLHNTSSAYRRDHPRRPEIKTFQNSNAFIGCDYSQSS